jgi:acyl carrier protein
VTSPSEHAPDGVVDAVIDVLRESQQLPDNLSLSAETVLLEGGLALDSVAVLELLLALEKRFARTVEQDEVTMENLRTIGAVARLVATESGARDAGDA